MDGANGRIGRRSARLNHELRSACARRLGPFDRDGVVVGAVHMLALGPEVGRRDGVPRLRDGQGSVADDVWSYGEPRAHTDPQDRSLSCKTASLRLLRPEVMASPGAHFFAEPGILPTLMVVVELVEPSGGLEACDRDELMAELEDSLAEAAGSTSSCSRLGRTELLVIAPDVELDDADAVVDEIVSAARFTTASLLADVVVGEVVVPDEAKDPRTALRAARRAPEGPAGPGRGIGAHHPASTTQWRAENKGSRRLLP